MGLKRTLSDDLFVFLPLSSTVSALQMHEYTHFYFDCKLLWQTTRV